MGQINPNSNWYWYKCTTTNSSPERSQQMCQTDDRRKHIPKSEKGKRGHDTLMTLPKLMLNTFFVVVVK